MLSLMSLFHSRQEDFDMLGLLLIWVGKKLRLEGAVKKEGEEEALKTVSLELHRSNHLLLGDCEYWRWFGTAKNGQAITSQALTELVEKELGVPVHLVYYLPAPPDVLVIYEEQQRVQELEDLLKKNEALPLFCAWMLR
jgi:hypothetical protein